MAISFYFYWDWIYSVWGWLFFILPVLTFIFLVIGCSDLKKDERTFESVKFLNIIGIILLSWTIIIRFLPGVMFSLTFPDYIIGLSYVLSLMIINHSLFIVFGIAFIKFGSRNKEHTGGLSLAAGILLVIAWSLSLSINILSFFIGALVIFLWIQWIIVILALVAATLILVNTILIKKVFMIIFAAILVSYGILNLLNLTPII